MPEPADGSAMVDVVVGKKRRPTKPSRAPKARRRRVPRSSAAAASPEELRLLRLASELTALGRGARPPAEIVDAALERLAVSGPASGRNGDKGQSLALAWAREQARLALADVLHRAATVGAARTDIGAETLAWLVFAGAEALAHEPADAVADRLHAITTFIRPPARLR